MNTHIADTVHDKHSRPMQQFHLYLLDTKQVLRFFLERKSIDKKSKNYIYFMHLVSILLYLQLLQFFFYLSLSMALLSFLQKSLFNRNVRPIISTTIHLYTITIADDL